ncbi:YolD-like family protein [Staphylococcus muscae]|uniref:YolD-like protein family protein n=1 Tax=Staphylococcus muscae TaxID=1294 RepID=A0A240C0F0_9STAP|nr:YolD-like family protein [Staphylococcus muscae]AVQ32673.1 YolD-like family protein [Staphylococcus muscae]PNZ05023.1 YolD-like family protein [Staphylococcus muscae]GGA90736.1 hypothetical protein GCM10007183_13660 [Staphylococcus muscae]SNW01239.1 YolD-like protein family protein [Staphylococcus muscae]
MKDKSLPQHYQYETDYRKIPREYLKTNIPKGRGIVKWAPFATLPEQFEHLKKVEQSQHKQSQPILSEDQLYELNYMLHLKLSTHTSGVFQYWSDGAIHAIEGSILYIHSQNQTLTITDTHTHQPVTLSFQQLCHID